MMSLNNFLADGKPESGSPGLLALAAPQLWKFLEEHLPVCPLDRFAFIYHGYLHEITIPLRSNGNRLSRRRKLDGIGQQVCQNLNKAVMVSQNRDNLARH